MLVEPGTRRHRDASALALRKKIDIDNRFRLAVSYTAFGVMTTLYIFHLPGDLHSLMLLLGLYSCPYLIVWLFLSRLSGLTAMRYLLSATDFVAITIAMHMTGGLLSPFFFLYPVPFLIHALHFEIEMIRLDAIVSVVSFSVLLWRHRMALNAGGPATSIGQLIFLVVVVSVALISARRFRKSETIVQTNVQILETTVQFLQEANALSPNLSSDALHMELARRLSEALRPLQIYCRLWLVKPAWKTLRGFGEHPALRPNGLRHLPTHACPAFALRAPFEYSQRRGESCPSEQFNYAKHLCVPVTSGQECFGVTFFGTYEAREWDPGEHHLFDMLTQSIGLTLQRRALFENLQEKIGELNFSYEAGAAALATFGGSTQGIDETTIHILDGVLSILKVDRASLMLWNARAGHLRTQWVRGGDFNIRSPMTLRLGEGMAGWALQTREPYWAEYAMGDPHYCASTQPLCSLLCVPVYTMEGEPLGVINAVTATRPRTFTSREIDFLKTFGRQAALAIENAQLHHKNRANIEQLKELNQTKSQFLSLVSHDLRGPLTGVRGFCEVLREQTLGPLNVAQMDFLNQLERQVDLQERMVDDLLDLARMEKGQLSMHWAPTDIVTLLAEEVEKSQHEAKERSVILTLSAPKAGSIPPLLLDGGRIRQVLWNLIYNALKFTPEQGRVIVRAQTERQTLLLEVEDTGVGLSADLLDRVFDKFFQVSPGGSKSAQGLGLGLAICKEIILAHQGTITARSPGLGQGTVISIRLPMRPADVAAIAAA